MYNKEKAKENYIKNRDKLNERAKQYYHDNKEARRRRVRIQTSNNNNKLVNPEFITLYFD